MGSIEPPLRLLYVNVDHKKKNPEQNADVANFKFGELRFYLLYWKGSHFQEVCHFIQQPKSLNLTTMITNLVEML
jgi:hypothetical protein